MSDNSTPALTLQELPELRRKTEAVSQLVRQQIAAHLETLRPLLAPERVFGKYAGSKTEVSGAERALAELQQHYKPFTSKPCDLPETFETTWLTLVGSALELHPWEYTQQVQGKPITMSSPVRWVVNYRANCTLTQVKNVLAGKEAARSEHVRQFIVNALVLQLMLNRQPGLVRLFADLHYAITFESLPDLPSAFVATISAGLPSFRPADELIQMATAFSGVPAFIELLDLAAAQDWLDPFRQRIGELLK